MNNTKLFSLLLLTMILGGCASSGNKPMPTNRDAICDDLKNQLIFYQTIPDGSTSSNQLDPAKQAELMKTYQKYNCDQAK